MQIKTVIFLAATLLGMACKKDSQGEQETGGSGGIVLRAGMNLAG